MSGPILLALRVAIIITLYAFLAVAFYILWMDIQGQSKRIASRLAPSLTLTLKAEADTRSYRFSTPEITIGRDPACDFCLEDKTISAKHARLAYHHGHWWAEDLHSTNGTFINQESLADPLVITTGDQLRCGSVVLLVSMGESSLQSVETGV
jgi:pSer/pThr/pTyr-binding forkhead associated (FHA) protein